MSRYQVIRWHWTGSVRALFICALCLAIAAGCSRRPPPPPPLEPGLHVLETSTFEDNGSIRFTVRLVPSREDPVTVEYETVQLAGGSVRELAQQGVDYTSVAGLLTFQPGDVSRVISVPVAADQMYEQDEKLSMRIFNASGADIISSRADGTIYNDDTQPVVTLSIDNAAGAQEGVASDERTISVNMSALSGLDTYLVLHHGGLVTTPAVLNVDYALIDAYGNPVLDKTTVVVPAGQARAEFQLKIIDDGEPESQETMVIELGTKDGQEKDVRLGSETGRRVVLRIYDNDSRLQGIAVNDTGRTGIGSSSECNIAGEDCSTGLDVAGPVESDSADGHLGLKYTRYVDISQGEQPTSDQFADTPWNCVRDERTGLVWEVKPATENVYSPFYKGRQFYWYSDNHLSNGGVEGRSNLNENIVAGANETCSGDATHTDTCSTAYYSALVNAAELCGLTGWRLPTAKELRSLLSLGSGPDYTGYNVSKPEFKIDQRFFPDMPGSVADNPAYGFWTADTNAQLPTQALLVSFMEGLDIVTAKEAQYSFENRSFLRLVNDSMLQDATRQSSSYDMNKICGTHAVSSVLPQTPTERFELLNRNSPSANIRNVAVDTVTGLMWDRCPYGASWASSEAGGCVIPEGAKVTWSQALALVDEANGMNGGSGYLGYSDWRLPNINELSSIIEPACSRVTMNHTVFPSFPVGNGLWSSTTYDRTPSTALYQSTNSGYVHITDKTATVYFRLVRNN